METVDFVNEQYLKEKYNYELNIKEVNYIEMDGYLKENYGGVNSTIDCLEKSYIASMQYNVINSIKGMLINIKSDELVFHVWSLQNSFKTKIYYEEMVDTSAFFSMDEMLYVVFEERTRSVFTFSNLLFLKLNEFVGITEYEKENDDLLISHLFLCESFLKKFWIANK